MGADVAYPSQYPHINRTGDVEFFASPEHGLRERITTMRAGRYLAKYFPLMPETDVARYASMAQAMAVMLRFATTREEIRGVYTSPGPQSCMDRRHNFDHLGAHPTEAYAAGDLAVAYIGGIGMEVTARCIVWPAKKLYGRRYGNQHQLEALLREDGYRGIETSAEGFTGAKMLKIPVADRYPNGAGIPIGEWVMPYIDGGYALREVDDHFVLCTRDFTHMCTAVGYAQAQSRCQECGTYNNVQNRHVFNAELDVESQLWCVSCWNHAKLARTIVTCSCGRAGQPHHMIEVYRDHCHPTMMCVRCTDHGRLTREINGVRVMANTIRTCENGCGCTWWDGQRKSASRLCACFMRDDFTMMWDRNGYTAYNRRTTTSPREWCWATGEWVDANGNIAVGWGAYEDFGNSMLIGWEGRLDQGQKQALQNFLWPAPSRTPEELNERRRAALWELATQGVIVRFGRTQ